jgi:hypothetical protein
MADKKISELNAALTIADSDDFAVVQAAETKQVNASVIKNYMGTAPTISGGTIDNAVIGGSTQAAGAFTSLTSSSTTTLNGTTIPASKTLLVSTDIGSSVQAYSANLDEYAAVNPTTAGLALLDDADAAAQRTTLGLVIGTDVQAYDSDLTAWAGKTAPTGDAVGTSDSQTLTNKTISGSSNTISNIGNSSLTNSSITFGSTATSLGGTVSALNGVSIGASTASTGAFTTLSASSTVSGSGFSTYLASPPAIGGTTPAAGNFTTLGATGNVTLGDASGDTVTLNAGTVTLNNSTVISAASTKTLTLNGGAGSNGLVLNASNNVGIGTGSPGEKLVVYSTTSDNQLELGYASTYSWKLGRKASDGSLRFTGLNGGATLTDAFVLNLSGNVGIGTSSPSYKLQVIGASSSTKAAFGSTTNPLSAWFYSVDGGETDLLLGATAANHTSANIIAQQAIPLCFYTSNTERMRLDASGNLGLGVTPSGWYSNAKSLEFQGGSLWSSTTTNMLLMANAYLNASASYIYRVNGAASYYYQAAGAHSWSTAPSGTAGNAISWTQAMTLDASGNLYVGDTGGLLNERIRVNFAAGNTGITVSVASTAVQSHIAFYNGSVVGTISTNGSATTYATSSDYRLKNTIAPMTGALVKVALLKPCTYKWNADGSDGEGFIAHELQKVVPQAVTGEKDGEQMQGVDYGKLTPLLVAAIQELHQELQTLKAKVN